jgi:hypothetical protein
MLRFKEGDRARIVDRPPTPADARTGLYYGYYRHLTGTIFKIYDSGPNAKAALEVDLDSLPEDVARRHLDVRDQMRGALTGEARRLSAPGAEQEFRLRYVILVALADLARPLASRARAANGNGKARLS